MKEFRCESLGHKCTWRHIAKTEELLADIVALHLRESHGMESLDTETVARIKNAFSNPTVVGGVEPETLVLKEYDCDLAAKCSWRYIAQTEELIVDGVAVHAREAHGITEFTPEMKVRVESTLREWKA